MLLTADFMFLSATQGMAMNGSSWFGASVQIPGAKSAVLDCEVDVGQTTGPDLTVTVKQSGGPQTTKTLKPGRQHLVVGVNRVAGLETLVVQSNAENDQRWFLRQCEVSFH